MTPAVLTLVDIGVHLYLNGACRYSFEFINLCATTKKSTHVKLVFVARG
jgi:hypothetical protein